MSTGDRKSSRLPWQKSYCWWGLLWWSFEKRLDCCDWNKNSAFPIFSRSPPWLIIFPSRTWRTMPLLTKRFVLEIFTNIYNKVNKEVSVGNIYNRVYGYWGLHLLLIPFKANANLQVCMNSMRKITPSVCIISDSPIRILWRPQKSCTGLIAAVK